MDLNHRMAGSKPAALPLGYTPVLFLQNGAEGETRTLTP